MTRAKAKSLTGNKAVKKITVIKSLEAKSLGPVVASADVDDRPKRERGVEDSDSPTGRDERTQRPLSKKSFESSDSVDMSGSTHTQPLELHADDLDKTQLPYGVAAEERAAGTASVAIGKKDALYTSTAFKPYALLELSWAQLGHLERPRSHGRLVHTQNKNCLLTFLKFEVWKNHVSGLCIININLVLVLVACSCSRVRRTV